MLSITLRIGQRTIDNRMEFVDNRGWREKKSRHARSILIVGCSRFVSLDVGKSRDKCGRKDRSWLRLGANRAFTVKGCIENAARREATRRDAPCCIESGDSRCSGPVLINLLGCLLKHASERNNSFVGRVGRGSIYRWIKDHRYPIR